MSHAYLSYFLCVEPKTCIHFHQHADFLQEYYACSAQALCGNTVAGIHKVCASVPGYSLHKATPTFTKHVLASA